LTSLVLKGNVLLTAEAGKVLSGMLATNTVLRVLDLSSNNWNEYSDKSGRWLGDGPGFAKELAVGISGNGALRSLHVGNNTIPEKELREIMGIVMHMDRMKVLCEVPFKDKTLTELDVSGKNLGTEGALVVAEYLDGNEAISSVNLLKNNIGVQQARALVIILKEHLTLKSLCGNKGDETKLDMSGKMQGAGDAIMLAAEIVGNGALLSLNLADNSIGGFYTSKGCGNEKYHPTPEGKKAYRINCSLSKILMLSLYLKAPKLSLMPSGIWGP
jgi:hypothetical protein